MASTEHERSLQPERSTSETSSASSMSRTPLPVTHYTSGTSATMGMSAVRTHAVTAAPLEKHDLIVQDEEIRTTADVTINDRIDLRINEKHLALTRHLSQLAQPKPIEHQTPEGLPPWLVGEEDMPPPLNLVIQVVGSRGDVQPFLALAKVLQAKYKHRVRLATHGTFKSFVEEQGVGFFNIGGDPANLMEYMVKNPGLMPGKQSLRDGDVGKRKQEIGEILTGCWRSCIESGDGMHTAEAMDGGDSNAWDQEPFVANAIIANPVSFAHVHCAEKLGIPTHFMFTMPWSPTQAFPHPLANIKSTNTDPKTANFISYSLVTMLTYQGLSSVINNFRESELGLEAISSVWFSILAESGRIPYSYMWSPALIPKPSDWGANIHVVGFSFLDLAKAYRPDPALQEFLDAGPPPVYIGFGSIVVADPNAMTNLIFEATAKAGVRVLISRGWGGFGSDELKIPDHVFLLGNVPHDWLFNHVSAVCHHGGAGTCAAGIAAGKPTIVVPFFGDQPFWGSMVARAGAGPPPIPHKKLTVDNLAAAIQFCLKEETLVAAKSMGAQIKKEDGPAVGARHFHSFLGLEKLRCSIDRRSVASWRIKRTKIRLSAKNAAILNAKGLLRFEDLKLNRPCEYDMSAQPTDPISGSVVSILTNMATLVSDTATLPSDIFKFIKTNTKTETRGTTGTRTSRAIAQPRSETGHSDETGDLAIAKAAGVHGLKPATRHRVHGAFSLFAREGFHMAHLPREVLVSLTRGFHNAPKLYSDHTVREPIKISGMQSGLKAAGQELGYGFYDGITGLVSQPWNGARREGGQGFVKGVGKGVGGLLFKPVAACLGLVSYTWEGAHSEVRAHHQKKSYNFDPLGPQFRSQATLEQHIAAIRLVEGYEALDHTTEEERQCVVNVFHEVQAAILAKKAKKDKERQEKWCPRQSLVGRHMSKAEGKNELLTNTTTKSSGTPSLWEEKSLDGHRPSAFAFVSLPQRPSSH